MIKTLIFMVLAVITGSMGLIVIMMDNSQYKLDLRVLGVILICSCIGHMIGFYQTMTMQDNSRKNQKPKGMR